MDGVVDAKTLITIVGILFSVAGAAAVGKMQIKNILISLVDIEKRMRAFDRLVDGLDVETQKQEQRINILAKMSDPEIKRRDTIQIATLEADLKHLAEEVASQHRMHNTVHPPVSNTRTAE
jgi:hypothetical protein|tara:strand:- start:884 stop:1246 length:363 start_codon:yes stop_codon:yes gene_type:complete